MSKADQMGESAAFGRVGNPRSARGRSKDNAFNNAGPSELALHLLSHNPENPREDIGDVTELANSLRDHKQKQAIAVMTIDAYLEANPGREDELEDHAAYVVIDGNRRLAAARRAGLKSLKVMLDDEGLGRDSNEILESALVANVFNQRLDALDEAKALKQLLDIHGTQGALAARLHRSQGWISQRLSLLNLTDDLQAKLEAGEESATHLRSVGKKAKEEQEAALAALKAKEAREKKEKAARVQARAEAKGQKAATVPPQPSLGEPTTPDAARVAAEPADAGSDAVTAPAAVGKSEESADQVPVTWMPFDDPSGVLRILRDRMTPEDFAQLAKQAQELT